MISLSDVLKPWEVVERRLDAAAGADFVLALYNPASSVRPWQCGQALAVIARHRSETTPVVVARDVGGPTETSEVVALGKVDPEAVDMRTVLIVGLQHHPVLHRRLRPRRGPTHPAAIRSQAGIDRSRGAAAQGSAPARNEASMLPSRSGASSWTKWPQSGRRVTSACGMSAATRAMVWATSGRRRSCWP